jgi:hypothetical protein
VRRPVLDAPALVDDAALGDARVVEAEEAEMARRVVVLPAPLVPSSAATLPRATLSDTPCTAVTTRW